ncbi:hypothetical protein [Streptomyces tibetensis]|uniref:hypothetical protein n=1 Tax=Streptomyces tibetensis TaxID=2382123 RepID=UPI0033FA1031
MSTSKSRSARPPPPPPVSRHACAFPDAAPGHAPDVVADKTYSSGAIRDHVREHAIRAVLPPGRPAAVHLAGLHIAGVFPWSAR